MVYGLHDTLCTPSSSGGGTHARRPPLHCPHTVTHMHCQYNKGRGTHSPLDNGTQGIRPVAWPGPNRNPPLCESIRAAVG